MKVKLLSSLSSINKTYKKGEMIDVADKQAIRMIKNKLAIPTNKKQYESAIKKLEEEKKLKLVEELKNRNTKVVKDETEAKEQ